MKANAPKKIYIPRLEGNKSFVHEWSATEFRKYFSREIAENVECIRADAFIEKAIEYMITHISDMHVLGISCKMDECIIEDFRKYMEE